MRHLVQGKKARPLKTTLRIIRAFHDDDDRLDNAPRRPCATAEFENYRIVEAFLKDPFCAARGNKARLGLNVSKVLIRRHLREAGHAQSDCKQVF